MCPLISKFTMSQQQTGSFTVPAGHLGYFWSLEMTNRLRSGRTCKRKAENTHWRVKKKIQKSFNAENSKGQTLPLSPSFWNVFTAQIHQRLQKEARGWFSTWVEHHVFSESNWKRALLFPEALCVWTGSRRRSSLLHLKSSCAAPPWKRWTQTCKHTQSQRWSAGKSPFPQSMKQRQRKQTCKPTSDHKRGSGSSSWLPSSSCQSGSCQAADRGVWRDRSRLWWRLSSCWGHTRK